MTTEFLDKEKPRINPFVFFGSSSLIVAMSLWAIIAPEHAERTIGTAVGWIADGFGWYYFVAATVFLGFVIYIAVSRYGTVKLGPQHSKPQFSMFSWASMLFAAGIGIDLMFFSVSEPVAQYLAPPEGQAETIEAARQAVVWTMFHYGITGWAMYALMGLVLGYFAFRFRLPLSIRSALYPLIGKRVHGRVGDAAELAAVIGTIFGIAVSLGIGVVQLNYGLKFMFGIPENVWAQVGLIVTAVVLATISVVTGVDRGIKLLSQLNVILAIALMLYVMVFESPIQLLNRMVLNIGDYVARFPSMTLNTFGWEHPADGWLNTWTLFFWAWWVAWAPFVGLFLARISRGRTIRQFVAATLIVPLIFTLCFLSIFGNSALNIVREGNAEFGRTAVNKPEQGFYELLAQYPGVTFSAGLATVVGLLFYVTSTDSGALVMGNFTSRLPNATTDAAKWVRAFWAVATGLLTLAMLLVGGVGALTNATIIMALPFSFVMFLLMIGLYRALRIERHREDAIRTSLPMSLSERVASLTTERTWRHRLGRAMSYPDRAAVHTFFTEVAKPALTDVAEELRTQGGDATVSDIEGDGLPRLELVVPHGDEETFRYQARAHETARPPFVANGSGGTYYRVEVYLTDGGQGYDVLGYTKEQLIGDLLDQYERHLEFLRLHRTSDEVSTPD